LKKLSTGRLPLTMEEAAGRLDTEGGFSVTMLGPYLRTSLLGGSNNVKEYSDEMKESFGCGGVFVGHDEHGNPKWAWWITRKRDISKFLSGVLPYLRVKRLQALLVSEWLCTKQEMLPHPNQRAAKESRERIIAERKAFVMMIHRLNKNPNIDSSSDFPPPNDTYTATAFDGEGYVGLISQKTNDNTFLRLSVSFSNKALKLIKDVRSVFLSRSYPRFTTSKSRFTGGSIDEDKGGVFLWNIRDEHASSFLRSIYPFLRNKDLQAWIGICYQEHVKRYTQINIGHSLDKKERELRYETQAFLKYLHFLDKAKSRASATDYRRASKKAATLVSKMQLPPGSIPLPPSAGRYTVTGNTVQQMRPWSKNHTARV